MAVVGTTPAFCPVIKPAFNPPPTIADCQGLPAGPSSIDNPQDGVTLSTFGQRLAQSALDSASDNTNLKRFRCYHFVKNGLEAEGISLGGKSAYLAANQLARNPHFKETKFTREELAELPAGAVVVWNRSKKHANGHISVALGDGREVSDRIRPQVQNYSSTFRVFLPNNEAPPPQTGG